MNQKLIGPNFGEQLDKLVVDHECDCHIQTYSAQTGHCAFVKSKYKKKQFRSKFIRIKSAIGLLIRFGPFIFHNLNSAVKSVLVFACLQTLHACFDHIHWRVAEYRCGTRNTAKYTFQNKSIRIIFFA